MVRGVYGAAGAQGGFLSTLTGELSARRLITLPTFFAYPSTSSYIRYASLPRSFALFPASGTELTLGEQACFTVPAELAR